MGAWNFMVDMSQYAKLDEHEDQLEELKTKVLNLEKWVVYLNSRLDVLQSNQSNTENDDELQ